MEHKGKNSPYHEWEDTLSGEIYHFLEAKSAQEGVHFEVINPGSITEIYRYGDEEAQLRKHAEAREIGEPLTGIHTFVEAYDYKRKDWWRSAIENIGTGISFLETPVVYAAKDAGISQTIYRPSLAIRDLQIYTGTDPEEELMCRIKARKAIIDTLNPRLMQHFFVTDMFGALRLVAQNDEAHKSHFEDNEVYSFLLQQMREAVPELQSAYEKMR